MHSFNISYLMRRERNSNGHPHPVQTHCWAVFQRVLYLQHTARRSIFCRSCSTLEWKVMTAILGRHCCFHFQTAVSMKYAFYLLLVYRLWWVAAIGLSLWLSFLMIHAVWLDWQKNPATVTKTNEVNPVSKIPFPTVMICPPTKVVRDKFDLSSKCDANKKLLPNVTYAE